jgi:hypothetical protein
VIYEYNGRRYDVRIHKRDAGFSVYFYADISERGAFLIARDIARPLVVDTFKFSGRHHQAQVVTRDPTTIEIMQESGGDA